MVVTTVVIRGGQGKIAVRTLRGSYAMLERTAIYITDNEGRCFMDLLITIVRIPVAGLFGLLIAIIGWPLEIIIGICGFPFWAVIDVRDALKDRYQHWPLNTLGTLRRLFVWATCPVEEEAEQKIDEFQHANHGLMCFLIRMKRDKLDWGDAGPEMVSGTTSTGMFVTRRRGKNERFEFELPPEPDDYRK